MWWSTVYTTDYTPPGESTSPPNRAGHTATSTFDTVTTVSNTSEPPSAILRHSSYPTDTSSTPPSATISASDKPTPAAAQSSPSPSVQTRLWHPHFNSSPKFRVPRLFLALLSLHTATAAQIPPHLTYTNLTTSWTSHPSSVLDPPPPHDAPLICPEGLARCGHALCYSVDAQRCCPGGMNLCGWDERCVEGRSEEGDVVYGCVLLESGDPQPRTAGVVSDRESVLTWSGTATATTRREMTTDAGTITTVPSTTQTPQSPSTSTTASASLSTPTRNIGDRLSTPSLLHNLMLFINSVRAVTFPAPIHPECCGDICCAPGEVCTRSWTGAKCWHAGKRDARDSTLDEELEHSDVKEDDNARSDNVGDKKGGGTAGAAAGGHHGGHHDDKKGSVARPKVSMLFYVVILMVTFVFAAPLDYSVRTSYYTTRSGIVYTSSVQAVSRDAQAVKHDMHDRTLSGEDNSVIDTSVGDKKRGGGRGGGGGGGRGGRGRGSSSAGYRSGAPIMPDPLLHGKKGGASRPTLPILLLTLLFLLSLITAATTSLVESSQLSPLPKTLQSAHNLEKR
jgi:hypothetical protein